VEESDRTGRKGTALYSLGASPKRRSGNQEAQKYSHRSKRKGLLDEATLKTNRNRRPGRAPQRKGMGAPEKRRLRIPINETEEGTTGGKTKRGVPQLRREAEKMA